MYRSNVCMYECMTRSKPKLNKSTLQKPLLNLTLNFHIFISFYLMGSPGFLQLWFIFIGLAIIPISYTHTKLTKWAVEIVKQPLGQETEADDQTDGKQVCPD